MKEKIESLRASEKSLLDERNSLLDKMRIMKNEMARKETMSKEIKEKLDRTASKLDTNKNIEDESERMKETIKKLKQDVERKETTMKSMRNKYEHAVQELERTRAESFYLTNVFICLKKKTFRN